METEEEEEQRAAREWQDDGRKGRVLVRRSEELIVFPLYRGTGWPPTCVANYRLWSAIYTGVARQLQRVPTYPTVPVFLVCLEGLFWFITRVVFGCNVVKSCQLA